MTMADLQALEEMAAKLEASTRKLTAPGRDELLQDIARFRAQVAAMQVAALRPSGEEPKAEVK